mmetsp:Transcript_6854/g.16229  ORF Transcript_6854/g.16229 Transcript_6854/m.16229 type:complete len:325 (-) Transcript_6854:50-1024(-)
MTYHQAQRLPSAVEGVIHPLLCNLCRDQRLQDSNKGYSKGCAKQVKGWKVRQRLCRRCNDARLQRPILVLQRGQDNAPQPASVGQIAQQDREHRQQHSPRDGSPLALAAVLHQHQQQPGDQEEEQRRGEAVAVQGLQGSDQVLVEVLGLRAIRGEVQGHFQLTAADDNGHCQGEAFKDCGGHQQEVALKAEEINYEDDGCRHHRQVRQHLRASELDGGRMEHAAKSACRADDVKVAGAEHRSTEPAPEGRGNAHQRGAGVPSSNRCDAQGDGQGHADQGHCEAALPIVQQRLVQRYHAQPRLELTLSAPPFRFRRCVLHRVALR